MSINLEKNEELKKYEKLADENKRLDKFRGSDIIKWAVKLKHDERTAKKYEGVSTVQEILEKAREDGFNFTEKELLDFNLDLVAGGGDGSGQGGAVGVGIGFDMDNGSNEEKKEITTKTNNQKTNMSGTVGNGSSGNGINFSNNPTVNQ